MTLLSSRLSRALLNSPKSSDATFPWATVVTVSPLTVSIAGSDPLPASGNATGPVAVGDKVMCIWKGETLIVISSPKQAQRVETTVDQTLQAAEDAVADATAALIAAGNAVTGAYDEYATGTSASTPPETGWSASTPPWTPGAYIWRRPVTTKGDGSTSTGEPVLVTGNSGTDAAVLRIDSSRGTAFKNSAISTVLTVTVFAGSEQITDIDQLRARFGMGAYLEWWWRRFDDSDFGVISAADPRLSQSSFALTVSPADVDEQTVFQCVLHT